ncbi:MAG: hypothetical protein A07HB70_00700 [uncultured archaeon A07HB70]|nr:MAG: hypothetical protein A07HB70_00700 [uncultured archaeon A07HB70]
MPTYSERIERTNPASAAPGPTSDPVALIDATLPCRATSGATATIAPSPAIAYGATLSNRSATISVTVAA